MDKISSQTNGQGPSTLLTLAKSQMHYNVLLYKQVFVFFPNVKGFILLIGISL